MTLKATDEDGYTGVDRKYVGVKGIFTGQRENGMVLIPAGGYLAPAFRYVSRAFWLDTASVRSGEYYSIFGIPLNDTLMTLVNNPVKSEWDRFLLFCNLKSKRDGLDTAFIYDSTLSAGPGLGYPWRCDFTKNGYRFPTEDEWRLA